MQGLTDFHTHILPGIDDGSQSVEESIALLRLQAAQGVTRVVATPHFYPRYDSPENFLRKRDRAEAALRRELEKHPELPEVIVGAEVYFFRGMSESDILSRLTIGGKRCILIEMPHAPWTDDMFRELEAVWERQRLLPVIAHIDRYIGPFRTHKIPQRLADMPVYVQANGSFFMERGTASMAMRMLRADQIQLLGSDCHNLTDRQPNLRDAADRIRRKLGPDTLDRIRDYESRILGV